MHPRANGFLRNRSEQQVESVPSGLCNISLNFLTVQALFQCVLVFHYVEKLRRVE